MCGAWCAVPKTKGKQMKKLFALAAIVLAVVTGQAATFKWSAANIYNHTGTAKYTGDVTLYAYLSTADASTAVAYSTVTASSAGTVAATTFSDDSLASGSNYNFFFVIEDGDYTFTSATKTNVAALETQTQTISFGNMTAATQNASNWTAAPEPTSGLLMLLGMAGLALRRKRA